MVQGREGGQPRQLLDPVNLANPANHTPWGDTTQGAREPGYLYASFPGTSCLLWVEVGQAPRHRDADTGSWEAP